jgi:2-amino-4-hydroxy-6-hydroxymethyldihydropteridine diphosphokinase
MDTKIACIGLGANLGDRHAALRAAVRALDAHPEIRVSRVARVYDTAPIGPEQPRYLNSAVRVQTSLEPLPLLEVMLDIERAHGRDRSRETRFGPRTLDLDLLYVLEVTLDTERLTVPHPRLHERAFALVPMLEVLPEAHARYAVAYAALGRLEGGVPMDAW